MARIILEGHIEVPESDLAMVLAELANHIDLTRAEAGCLEFAVNQRPDNPRVFDVHEQFESQEAFDKHQARVRTSKWGVVTVNVARHYQITER